MPTGLNSPQQDAAQSGTSVITKLALSFLSAPCASRMLTGARLIAVCHEREILAENYEVYLNLTLFRYDV